MIAAQLVAAFERRGIPVSGVTIGAVDDRSTWTVQYKGATASQQAAGAELVATFDPDADTDYLEERAEAAVNVYLDKPEAQAVMVVLSEFFDVQVADVRERLKSAYKSAYTLPC